jgi:hypothetical protein
MRTLRFLGLLLSLALAPGCVLASDVRPVHGYNYGYGYGGGYAYAPRYHAPRYYAPRHYAPPPPRWHAAPRHHWRPPPVRWSPPHHHHGGRRDWRHHRRGW